MSPPLPITDINERYAIVREIGVGGMGRVYLADDLKHGRPVAVKVLDGDLRHSDAARFGREIRIASMLSHPNIVPIHDSGEAGGRLFYVMPFVEGEDLRRRLQREPMLPLPQVLQWALEISDALAYAHSRGVLHRDIKPANLLISNEHAVIADFGVASATHSEAADPLTSEQIVLGTPVYMSPEQAGGSHLDERSDVYSFACVVYEMLIGEPPYSGATQQAITAKKLSGRYPPVRIVRPRIPRAVDRVLRRALEPIPGDRYASATEFAVALQAAFRSTIGRSLAWILLPIAVGSGIAFGMSRWTVPQAAATTRPRVLVAMFDNRTGNPHNESLGFMAADWVTEGLQQTGKVDVVPTLTALAAHRRLRDSTTGDPVQALAREVGATLVVTGSIYEERDTLVLQAQVADAKEGKLVGAVEPIRMPNARRDEALLQLRSRLMGLLALSLDDRALQSERPPTYAAYQAFSEGMGAYLENDYDTALSAFERAHGLDTTFVQPLLYAAFCYSSQRRYALADSVLHVVGQHRAELNAYDQDWLDYQSAELAGDDPRALLAIRRAALLAPASKAPYNFAARAFEARQPFTAESALVQLSPDVGPMRGWLPYWEILTSSLHAQGKHRAELKAAREALRRFPDRIATFYFAGHALAAQGKLSELERIWAEATGKADATAAARGGLAYEIGSELWAHGSERQAHDWFERAYSAYASGNSHSSAERWGQALSAERIGRLREALGLATGLVAADTTRADYYRGFVGILQAQLGNSAAARDLLEELAADRRPFAFGEPQFQAARIAATLGDTRRAGELLALATRTGHPYDLDLHRDPALAAMRNLPAFAAVDIIRH